MSIRIATSWPRSDYYNTSQIQSSATYLMANVTAVLIMSGRKTSITVTRATFLCLYKLHSTIISQTKPHYPIFRLPHLELSYNSSEVQNNAPSCATHTFYIFTNNKNIHIPFKSSLISEFSSRLPTFDGTVNGVSGTANLQNKALQYV
jgi:hypothetical protein